MSPLVWSFRGQWMDTKSLLLSKVGTSTTSTPALPTGSGLREEMRTFMPNARAMSVTREPMVPRPPTSPRVFPCTSKCGRSPSVRQPRRSLSASFFCCCMNEQLRLSTMVMAMWAMASVLYVGMLDTVMPLTRAASMSMLLKPVPDSAMSFTDGGSRLMTEPGTGISLVIMICAPSARSGSSWGAVSSKVLICATLSSPDQSRLPS
mmetsp:Transcript_28569/g.80549  ORF Transcript_28569/g.80549 Transcript_28569/m.80549 type:complete len:206 (+) Transcript_28569:277-894(+)